MRAVMERWYSVMLPALEALLEVGSSVRIQRANWLQNMQIVSFFCIKICCDTWSTDIFRVRDAYEEIEIDRIYIYIAGMKYENGWCKSIPSTNLGNCSANWDRAPSFHSLLTPRETRDIDSSHCTCDLKGEKIYLFFFFFSKPRAHIYWLNHQYISHALILM